MVPFKKDLKLSIMYTSNVVQSCFILHTYSIMVSVWCTNTCQTEMNSLSKKSVAMFLDSPPLCPSLGMRVMRLLNRVT